MRIAIIGSGIAGNVAAYHLHRDHEITVFEAGDRIGGHTHTHTIEASGRTYEIDTGFIVYNDRTYPHFVRLLDTLGVASQPSAMSFSVRNERSGLEYNGTTVDSLFAQRRNVLRPSFHRMILDILRFNREAPRLLDGDEGTSLGDYLMLQKYGARFIEDYLVPMGAAIWSTEPGRILEFPAQHFVRFFHNHGMLSVNDRPQWKVIRGGSARYVDKLVAPFRDRVRTRTPVISLRRLPDRVLVHTASHGTEPFDAAFVACHSDEALRLLADPCAVERDVLGAIPYQENEAVLHTDTALLPRARKAWAAWNYHVLSERSDRVALTYDMNILQTLDAPETFCVTLNRTEAIDPRRVIRRMTYHHPLFTPAAVAAQRRQAEVNGPRRTYYCGAYWGFGFHEDGVVSALAALRHFQSSIDAQRDLQRVA